MIRKFGKQCLKEKYLKWHTKMTNEKKGETQKLFVYHKTSNAGKQLQKKITTNHAKKHVGKHG